MNPMNRIAVVNDHLLHEIVHTDLSLRNVLFAYGCLVVFAIGLWAIGAFTLGRRHSRSNRSKASRSSDRVTPVAP